jgi:uncharacterized protein (DUF2344 family)
MENMLKRIKLLRRDKNIKKPKLFTFTTKSHKKHDIKNLVNNFNGVLSNTIEPHHTHKSNTKSKHPSRHEMYNHLCYNKTITPKAK